MLKVTPELEQFAVDSLTSEVQAQQHPNFGSKNATPGSRLIDLHYQRLFIYERWTWERFDRLAAALKITPYELASIVGLPHKCVAKWEYKTQMPLSQHNGGLGVALCLTVLEAHILAAFTEDIIKNPYPDLTKVLKRS